MPLPTFVAAGAFAHGTGDVTPGLPSGWAENDIFLLCCETASATVGAPSGWTEVTGSPQTNSDNAIALTRLTVFWRRATASESAPLITDPGDHCIAVIIAIRGCKTTGDPWNITAGSIRSFELTASIPGATTTAINCLVAAIISCHSSAPGSFWTNWANADLANVTERADDQFNDGTPDLAGGGLGVVTGEKATAGAYGVTTADRSDGFQAWYGQLAIALEGSSAAPPRVPYTPWHQLGPLLAQ